MKLRWIGLIAIALLVVLAVAAKLLTSPKASYIKPDGATLGMTDAPVGLRDANVSYQHLNNGTTRITVTYSAPFDIGSDRLLFEAWFGDAQAASFSEAVVATFTDTRYYSSPEIGPNSAGVVNGSYSKVASGTLASTTVGFTVDVPTTSLSELELVSASVRYLSGTVPWTETLAGMFTVEVIALYSNPNLTGMVVMPSLPRPPSATNFGPPPPGEPVDRDLTPIGWGPPNGRWQPAPPGLPKTDIDGDGVNDDHVLPGRDVLPGTSDVFYQGITLDNGAIVMVLYRDRNANGKPERGEVITTPLEVLYEWRDA